MCVLDWPSLGAALWSGWLTKICRVIKKVPAPLPRQSFIPVAEIVSFKISEQKPISGFVIPFLLVRN
jgi:hypothetical protein